MGVDISPLALALANKNLQNLIAEGTIQQNSNLRFLQADVLSSTDGHGDTAIPSLESALEHYNSTSDPTGSGKGNWDILISNPPYISPQAFDHTTTRSVKRYEPRLALVPPPPPSSSPPFPATAPPTTTPASQTPTSATTPSHTSSSYTSPPRTSLPHAASDTDSDTNQGDLFYPHLLSLAASHSTKIAIFEVADLHQATRIAAMALHQNIWDGIQIWRDDPSFDHHQQSSAEMAGETVGDTVLDGKVKVVGQGNGRSVVVYRGVGKQWLGVED